MEGLTFFLFALCAILLYRLLRQRKALRQLTQQTDRFLEGGEALSVSLKADDLAALQNSLSRLQNRLLLSQEQTRLEARRSENLLTDISHQLKTPLASLQLFVELDQGAHLEQEQAQLERMQALISGLLRLERLFCTWRRSAPAVLISRMPKQALSIWSSISSARPLMVARSSRFQRAPSHTIQHLSVGLYRTRSAYRSRKRRALPVSSSE